jgi:hypothetical protein
MSVFFYNYDADTWVCRHASLFYNYDVDMCGSVDMKAYSTVLV